MKNRNLTNRVYHDVRNRILNFQLLPGAKVSDKDIAQQMGISRSPVRQALFRLAEQGLLQTRPNKGFVVKVHSPEELQDLFVFREAMEVKAIDLAVKKLTDRDIDRLSRQVDTYHVSIGKNDIRKLNQMDRAIHATLMKLGGNRFMIEYFNSLCDRIQISFPQLRYTEADLRIIHEEHKQIVAHIIQRDAKKVKTALSAHIRIGLEEKLRAFRNV